MAAGDANSLRVLTARYAPALTAMALHLLNDQDAAEEIASVALWRAWSEAKLYDPRRSSVGQWLVGIARRQATDRVRRANGCRQHDHPPAADSAGTQTSTEHERIANLLPLAAVDRLQPDQNRLLQEHLRQGCDRCERELRELRNIVAALDRSERSEHRVWQRLEGRLHAEAAAAHSLARAVSRPRRIGQGEPRSSIKWWRGLALFALGTAILLFAAYDRIIKRARHGEVRQLEQLESLNWQLNHLRADAASARMQAESLRGEVAAEEKFVRLLTSPDSRVIRLVPAGPARATAGLVASSDASHTAMVQALGLPAPPTGKAYVLWWITRYGSVKAGLLAAGPQQLAVAPLSMPPPGQRVIAATLTLEPAGVQKPRGPVFLQGSVERE